ncbi:hypothetical protein CCH79_00015976, partial [Gambusia affinis]
FTPCQNSTPELTWNLQQDSLRQTEKNTNGTFTTKIQENITLSDTHDGYNISCSARYPVIGGNKTAETEVTLNAPKDTSASISPSGLVSAGSWVELSCSSRAKPPPSFTWFRNSEHGDINVSMGKVYSFNVTEGGEYYCVATNRLGNETSSVILVITKGVKLLVPVIVGIIVVICFLVFLVSQMDIDLGVQNPAFEQEEELHYGEVKVTSKTPTVSLKPAQDNEQQETVYAQVNVSTPENPPTQADGGPENYYTEEHQSVTVTCSAFTPCPHSPPELTWNLQQDSLRQTEKNTDGTFTTKIQESITLSDTHDGYNIRCSARYPVIGGNKTAETEMLLETPQHPSVHQVWCQQLSENMLRVNLILSVVFLPGVLAKCPNPVLIASTPGQIEALNGSCLQIPCSFSTTDWNFDINKAIYGIWLKKESQFNANPSPIIFNSDGSVNKYSLSMTGNLREKNCTTLFPDLRTSYTDKYFLRIQNERVYKATDVCNPLHITVKAFTPCPHSPPELTWNLQQDSPRQTEKNTDGTFTTKIQESITLSDTHDGYNIRCSARYPVIGGNKTAETEVTLNAPKDTSASISPSAGSWVDLSCSSRAKPPITSFTWFKNSAEGAIKLSEGQVHRFSAIEGGEYYCMAINDQGNQTCPVILVIVTGLPFNPLYWGIIPVGCIVFICLFAGFWYFNSKYQAPKLTQGQNSEVQMSASKPEQQLHYGEIIFCRKTPEISSKPVQHDEQTVYA